MINVVITYGDIRVNVLVLVIVLIIMDVLIGSVLIVTVYYSLLRIDDYLINISIESIRYLLNIRGIDKVIYMDVINVIHPLVVIDKTIKRQKQLSNYSLIKTKGFSNNNHQECGRSEI